MLRDGVMEILEGTGNFEVTGRAANGLEAVTAFKEGAEADVVILDINMPIMNGYDAARHLKEINPAIKILFLTMLDSDFSVAKALQLGAKGVAKKDIVSEDLQYAIRTIAAGGFYYSLSANEKLAGLFRDAAAGASLLQNLDFTAPEIQFLKHVGSDLGYKEIGTEMKLTPREIDVLKTAVFNKAGVKTRNALVLFGIKSGLVEI